MWNAYCDGILKLVTVPESTYFSGPERLNERESEDIFSWTFSSKPGT